MSAFSQPGGTSVPGSSSNSTTQEYVVRAPQERKKKFCMMKFTTGTKLDFLKLTQTPVKMDRENNLKEYKSAYDIDTMPKFGAGSEFGREQKEEARRKKFGIRIKKYNPEDQPWIMKVGSGKQATRYKGVREGTITDNTSYYIFTQCADGAFEAWPIEEWYNFSQMIKYKYLNSEEAEEEFNRRDKTLNLFSVMVRKRVRGDVDDDKDLDEEEKKLAKSKKKKKKNNDLMLTEMEDWMDSDEDERDEDEDEREGSDDEGPKGKGKKGAKAEKGKKNAKHNSDDEAVEESDEGDFDDREVDYMTDSSSISSDDDREKLDKYEEKGVDMESGLKKLIDSEESSEEEEKKDEEEEEDEDKPPGTEIKKEGSESSSSSSSDSDSDIEKEEKFTSALFMQKKISEKNGSSRSGTPRSGTPTSVNGEPSKGKEAKKEKAEGVKRKIEEEAGSAKKMRTESPVMSGASSSEDITEESIRRYLTRKPMTAKELVQKFKSKKLHMSKEEMTSKIGKLLKKINPEKKYVNQIMYLSLKKSE